MPIADTAIPVNVITGFLGSGKTTLLKQLLESPKLSNTAVLINEFGEIGLDHMLLEHIDEETVILQSGCVCCAIRDDLGAAMRELYDKRTRGEIPKFDRIAIETTGLADPAPIVFTLLADPVLKHHFRLGNVVTTVDGVNADLHLRGNPETTKQVAVADRLVLTKTDLTHSAAATEIKRRLEQLNPAAPVFEAGGAALDPDALISNDLFDPDNKSAEVRRWLAAEAEKTAAERDSHAHPVNRHAGDIHSFCVVYDTPLDWTAFGLWMSMLLHAHGQDILRIKGLLNVRSLDTPVVIHGVQHLVHPPVHLDAWPDGDRTSRLVFIVRALDQSTIERSLAAFNALSNPNLH